MYSGPFLIVKELGPVNYVIQLSKRSQPIVVHVDKLKSCLGETPESWLLEDRTEEEKLVGPTIEDLTELFQVEPETVGVPLERNVRKEPDLTQDQANIEDPTVDSRPKRARFKPSYLNDFVV
jgi:hypothetical protein